MSSAGFEPDHAGAKRIQPFPLETTTHGIDSIGYKLIHENFNELRGWKVSSPSSVPRQSLPITLRRC